MSTALAPVPPTSGVVMRGTSPTMQTFTGRLVPLLDPTPADISLHDIADQLAKLCRFTGAVSKFYSVAQHSVFVTDHVSTEAKPYALLHDAHEAYAGDASSPLKIAMRAFGKPSAYDCIVQGLDRAIHLAAGLAWPPPPAIEDEVRHADLIALSTERRDLMARGTDDWPDLPPPATKAIAPWAWPAAMHAFHKRFEQVAKTCPSILALKRA